MTDEDTYTPTFSHLELPTPDEPELSAPAHQPKAPGYGPATNSMADLIERLSAVMAPPGADDQAAARATRREFLHAVWQTLPDNMRASRAELEQRTKSARLRQEIATWWFDGPNLLIVGRTGKGKTSGLALLVRRLIEDAIKTPQAFDADARKMWRGCGSTFELAGLIRWQSCRELSQVSRETPLGQGAPEAVARCQNARLLVLDDVGATDDALSLERVLNARYERGWPTHTTSGLTSRELSTTFGEALVRRMLQRRGQNGRLIDLFKEGQP
jgi:DNA replication protein DnaC